VQELKESIFKEAKEEIMFGNKDQTNQKQISVGVSVTE
jgi:hypothetical protein